MSSDPLRIVTELIDGGSEFANWPGAVDLSARTRARLTPEQHGDLMRWASAVARIPTEETAPVRLDGAMPEIGRSTDPTTQARVEALLRELRPWRKGPFRVLGVPIDAEWRCERKWERVAPAVDVRGASVLDVGSGNGYYCLRCLGGGAKRVLGVDPSLLFVVQFAALRRVAPELAAWVLPLALEQLPESCTGFDVVFSMGVLYHRRSPLLHLSQLKERLSPGGTLVLESLCVEGPSGYALTPSKRYAQMSNVWFIPSLETLIIWLQKSGYRDVRTVDVSVTTVEEQRTTSWSGARSLVHALDPRDPTRTIEGHPAPRRALLTARVP